MNSCVCGIDLGTSAVKLLCRYADGTTIKARESYDGMSCDSWWQAVVKALSHVERSAIIAIGLSAQVGTYIVDGQTIISWNEPVGSEALADVQAAFSTETFISELAMPHPPLVSYPMPRLLHIKRLFPNFRFVCQAKDFLCAKLTGNCVTDPYSWRGLAHTQKGSYSDRFLDYLAVAPGKLPRIVDILAPAGFVTSQTAQETGLSQGIPVYTGCNDFFAGLLGMGIWQAGDVFDISGTSEHVGLLTDHLIPDTSMVSGPYLHDFVHYGVTASSGVSLDFGRRQFTLHDLDIGAALTRRPPIFLPYLNGERAPIWDLDAKGLFMGIGSDCSSADLAYSVLEGVAFSLYHIFENLGVNQDEKPSRVLLTAGGAANDQTLNTIKAEIIGLCVQTLMENDTSALGAAMMAAVGKRWYPTLLDAQKEMVVAGGMITPSGRFNAIFKQRFHLYKSLYPALKGSFEAFGGIVL